MTWVSSRRLRTRGLFCQAATASSLASTKPVCTAFCGALCCFAVEGSAALSSARGKAPAILEGLILIRDYKDVIEARKHASGVRQSLPASWLCRGVEVTRIKTQCLVSSREKKWRYKQQVDYVFGYLGTASELVSFLNANSARGAEGRTCTIRGIYVVRKLTAYRTIAARSGCQSRCGEGVATRDRRASTRILLQVITLQHQDLQLTCCNATLAVLYQGIVDQ